MSHGHVQTNLELGVYGKCGFDHKMVIKKFSIEPTHLLKVVKQTKKRSPELSVFSYYLVMVMFIVHTNLEFGVYGKFWFDHKTLNKKRVCNMA